jgi:general secretion pathway protein E
VEPRYAALGLQADETVHEPGGCERCGGTGYRGRVGVFELLEMAPDIRALVDGDTDSASIDACAVAAGMTTMVEDGTEKCRAGVTSAAEVLRVTTIR